MTRAGRILGAMMAMGAELNDYERAGCARPRERYERWCAMRGFGARLVGDTSPTAQEQAEAKRARKAAKRRRDAELTRLGAAWSRARVERDTTWHLWCRGAAPALNVAANARMAEAWKRWVSVCQGEVQP